LMDCSQSWSVFSSKTLQPAIRREQPVDLTSASEPGFILAWYSPHSAKSERALMALGCNAAIAKTVLWRSFDVAGGC
jgi:hypothetical protein